MTTGPNDDTRYFPVEPAAGPASRCKRPAGPLTRRQRREAHVAKMARKKILRSLPETGFLPVPNRRINGAVDLAVAAIVMANAEAVQAGLASPLDPMDARDLAIREVARNLPRPPMVFDWRKGLPTKNNNPAYRGQNGNGPRRLAAMGATA